MLDRRLGFSCRLLYALLLFGLGEAHAELSATIYTRSDSI